MKGEQVDMPGDGGEVVDPGQAAYRKTDSRAASSNRIPRSMSGFEMKLKMI